MKAYLITTGIVFALLTVAHAARIYAEGWFHAKEPIFIATTIASLGLCVWAVVLLKKIPPGGRT